MIHAHPEKANSPSWARLETANQLPTMPWRRQKHEAVEVGPPRPRIDAIGEWLYMAAMIRSSKIVRPMTRAIAMRRRRGGMARARVRA
jgi:hypothetical protein